MKINFLEKYRELHSNHFYYVARRVIKRYKEEMERKRESKRITKNIIKKIGMCN